MTRRMEMQMLAIDEYRVEEYRIEEYRVEGTSVGTCFAMILSVSNYDDSGFS